MKLADQKTPKTLFLSMLFVLGIAAISNPVLGDVNIVRTIEPESGETNSEFFVLLNLTINQSERYLLVVENIPAGMSVQDSGTGNTSTSGAIKWAFYNQTPLNSTLLNYTLKGTNSGTMQISGEYVYETDNTTQEVGGENNIVVTAPPTPTSSGGSGGGGGGGGGGGYIPWPEEENETIEEPQITEAIQETNNETNVTQVEMQNSAEETPIQDIEAQDAITETPAITGLVTQELKVGNSGISIIASVLILMAMTGSQILKKKHVQSKRRPIKAEINLHKLSQSNNF